MYIEFTLPSGSSGMAAGYTKMSIWRRIQDWAHTHNQSIKYTQTEKYRFRVQFKNDRALTMLALSWDNINSWHKYTVYEGDIEPNE